jgi:hypothetical protein
MAARMVAQEDAHVRSEIFRKLDALYLNPAIACALSGFNKLWKCSKNIEGATRALVRDYLRSQPSYNRFRPKRKQFKRRPFLAFALNSVWQCDLADLTNLSGHNAGVKFVLVAVDTLSSYVHLRPCKSKRGDVVATALESIFREGTTPKQICTDHGLEFWNRDVFQLMSVYNIIIYSTQNYDTKCAQAERQIRILKNRVYRFISLSASKRYIDALQDIAKAMNHSVNRSIKMKPADVTVENQDRVFETRYGRKLNALEYSFRHNVDDVVRTVLPKDIFRKESEPQFSRALHRVVEARATKPHTYKVEAVDSRGAGLGTLLKAYYSCELSGVVHAKYDEKLPKEVQKKRRRLF